MFAHTQSRVTQGLGLPAGQAGVRSKLANFSQITIQIK